MAKVNKPDKSVIQILPDKSDGNKKNMIEALQKNLGIVSKAVEEVGICRDTHYRWLKEDADYLSAVKDVTERSIDFVETQLYNLIAGSKRQVVTNQGNIVEVRDAPNPTAIIFYLKTKGKHRGYIEKQEIELSLGQNISAAGFLIKERDY